MVKQSDMILSPEEKAAIAQAIEVAESKTSGEIFCVVAQRSGDYAWTNLVLGAVLALLVPVGLLASGTNPIEIARAFDGGWIVAHRTGAGGDAATGLAIVVALQAMTFIVISLLGFIAPVRKALTPRFVKTKAVHRAAMEQFLAHGIHLTDARTGVLVYVSLDEHQAEIVADAGIYKKVDKAVWRDAIGALLSETRAGNLGAGLIAAINASGAVLAEHFKPSDDDQDELPNRVVIL